MSDGGQVEAQSVIPFILVANACEAPRVCISLSSPGKRKEVMDNIQQEIVRLERPSPETVFRFFISQNRPVVITGVASKWRAVSQWTPEYFKSSFADVQVTYATWASDKPINEPSVYLKNRKTLGITLGNYIDLMRSLQNPRDYMLSFPIFRHIPQLRQDIESLDQYMKFPAYYPKSLKIRLKEEPRFFLGPTATVSLLHFDGYDNFFVQIYGRKKFLLLSPQQSRLVYYPWHYPHINYSPVNVEQPDTDSFPLFKEAKPLEVIVEPGEILFIPVGWWHYARALEESISLNFWWYYISTFGKLYHPLFMYGKGKAVSFLRRHVARFLKGRR